MTVTEARSCPRCQAPLEDDQEWCLECGTATTVIHTAPDWRVPVAIVAFIVAIALAGYFVAVDRLSSSSTPAAPTTSVASAGGLVRISEWPAGVPGWTVVLAHSRSEAVAYSKATRLADEGVSAGVIDSSHHAGWAPGYWVVFSGRYLTNEAAKTAARQLLAEGHHGAHAKLVERATTS